jgi:hypothetical protein
MGSANAGCPPKIAKSPLLLFIKTPESNISGYRMYLEPASLRLRLLGSTGLG